MLRKLLLGRMLCQPKVGDSHAMPKIWKLMFRSEGAPSERLTRSSHARRLHQGTIITLIFEVGGSKVALHSAGKSVPVNSAVQSAGRTLQASMLVDHQVGLEDGGSKVELHTAGQSVPVNAAVQNAGRTLQASMMVIPAAWQHHIPLGHNEPFGGLGVPAKAFPVPKAFPGPM